MRSDLKSRKMLIFSWIFFAVAFVVFLISLFFYLSHSYPIDRQDYYAEVNFTENRAGFDTNRSALIFGNVPLAGSATRLVTITNSYSFTLCAKFSVSGEISKFILLPKPSTILPGSSETFSVSVSPNDEALYGIYSGNVRAGLYLYC